MTVSWVLEANVFSEKCFTAMVGHFSARGIPYSVVKVIPFIHEIEGKVPELTNPVVVYGSIGVQKLAKTHGWVPGIFGDAEAFSEARAEQNLVDLYANFGLLKTTIKKLGQKPELFAKLLGGVDEFFLKPNTDTKEFAGLVIEVSKFSEWYAGMLKSGYLDENDFEVVVSAPKTFGCEWRVVVVDGKISSASLYRQYQSVMPERHILPEVETLVMKAHARYRPAPVYVIDVAQVWEDGHWTYKVVEYNTFNSAGLYDCDAEKIIDDINTFVEKQ